MVQNGSYSDYTSIESGVPQGSVLGPLLFLVYINDLERNIKSNVKFFADDTMLFSIVKDPELYANDLVHDPLGLRYLTQLRVGLSFLRCQKKCHNFIYTLSENCLCNNGIEDTSHFLFSCPFFAAQRARSARAV